MIREKSFWRTTYRDFVRNQSTAYLCECIKRHRKRGDINSVISAGIMRAEIKRRFPNQER